MQLQKLLLVLTICAMSGFFGYIWPRGETRTHRETTGNRIVSETPATSPPAAESHSTSHAPEDRVSLLDGLHFIDPADAGNLMEKLRRLGAPDYVVRALMVEGWKRFLADPAQRSAAFLPACGKLPTDSRQLFLSTRFEALAGLAPDQLESELNGFPAYARSKLASESVLGYASSHPGEALLLARRLNKSGAAISEKDIFHQWGKLDPAAALDEAGKVSGAAAKRAAENGIYTGWVMTDSAACLKALNELPEKSRPLLDLGQITDENIQAVTRALMKMDESGASALQALRHFSGAQPEFLAHTLFAGLAGRDWKKAAELYTSQRDSAEFQVLASKALAGMAVACLAGNTLEALPYLLQQLKDRSNPQLDNSQAINAFADASASLTGEARSNMIDSLLKLGDASARSVAERVVIESFIGNTTLDSAIAEISAQFTAASRERIIAGMIKSGPQPESALQNLTLIKQPYLRAQLLESVLYEWGATNGVAALAWAGQNETNHPGAMKYAMKAWTAGDPQGASEAIAALPPGPGRDPFIPTLAVGMASSDPDLAVGWALSVSDSSLKEETLSGVVDMVVRTQGTLESLLEAKGISADDETLIRNLWAQRSNK